MTTTVKLCIRNVRASTPRPHQADESNYHRLFDPNGVVWAHKSKALLVSFMKRVNADIIRTCLLPMLLSQASKRTALNQNSEEFLPPRLLSTVRGHQIYCRYAIRSHTRRTLGTSEDFTLVHTVEHGPVPQLKMRSVDTHISRG